MARKLWGLREKLAARNPKRTLNATMEKGEKARWLASCFDPQDVACSFDLMVSLEAMKVPPLDQANANADDDGDDDTAENNDVTTVPDSHFSFSGLQAAAELFTSADQLDTAYDCLVRRHTAATAAAPRLDVDADTGADADTDAATVAGADGADGGGVVTRSMLDLLVLACAHVGEVDAAFATFEDYKVFGIEPR
jgi:hypothetical protein